ncbi:MAG: hypothetical protein J6K01_07575 [Paludibacteraceae bacterium]|nr:hypothetical protein [Paludibacteraceae bacterium]
MKRIFLLGIAFVCIVAAKAQYHCTVMTSTRSTITLRATGYGKNVKKATAEAERNAVRMILFSGADGTSFRFPLIQEDRDKVEDDNRSFFNDLYRGVYRDFIESSVVVTPFGKDASERKCVTVDVCVRAERLRSYLESKKIIRKFGL